MNTTDYTYNQLTSADIEQLKELNNLFAEAFEEPETYQAKAPSDAYLQNLLGKDHFIALVALQEGKVAGGLAAYELEKFEQERKEIFIYDLAVAEAHRQKGVATGLLTTLRELARGRGAYTMFIQADEGDTAPINLYSKFAKRLDMHHFEIEVD